MTHGICKLCNQFRKLTKKVCKICRKEILNAFHYSIDGKKLSKKKYDIILNRGYVIPEELEDIRNE